MVDFSQGQLRALINQMVEQAVGEKLGARAASWQTDHRQSNYARLSYDQSKTRNGAGANWGAIGRDISSIGYGLKHISQLNKAQSLDQATEKIPSNIETFAKYGDKLQTLGSGISGAFGMYSAFKNGDALGGMSSGQQLGTAVGQMLGKTGSALQNAGWIGMGLGLLMGLFSKPKEIDEWNKPKFQDAEKAYNKLFTVDRGEEDLYYMPESFYFRSGWSGPRHIVVKVGNDQFDNHIRESMTSSYATQLQRGLVF